jgi:hypothetical protein
MKISHPTALSALLCFALLSPRLALGQFSQQGPKLVGTGAEESQQQQGSSVSLSADGNTALVGGSSVFPVSIGFPPFSGAGAAWIWTRSGGVWTQQGNKLVGSMGSPEAAQGFSVSLSADGNTAIIGGPGAGAGAVWIFTRVGAVWSQQGAKLVGAGAVGSFAHQGASVSLSLLMATPPSSEDQATAATLVPLGFGPEAEVSGPSRAQS